MRSVSRCDRWVILVAARSQKIDGCMTVAAARAACPAFQAIAAPASVALGIEKLL
jgi:hypothetical protein